MPSNLAGTWEHAREVLKCGPLHIGADDLAASGLAQPPLEQPHGVRPIGRVSALPVAFPAIVILDPPEGRLTQRARLTGLENTRPHGNCR